MGEEASLMFGHQRGGNLGHETFETGFVKEPEAATVTPDADGCLRYPSQSNQLWKWPSPVAEDPIIILKGSDGS